MLVLVWCFVFFFTSFYAVSAFHRYRSVIGHVIVPVWEDPGAVAILVMQVNCHWHICPGKFILFQNLSLPVQITVFGPVSLILSDFGGEPDFNFRLHWKAHELRFKTKFPETVLGLQLIAKPQTTSAYCLFVQRFQTLFAYRLKASAIPYCKIRVILLTWAQCCHKDYFCIAIFAPILSPHLCMLFLCRLKCNTVTP